MRWARGRSEYLLVEGFDTKRRHVAARADIVFECAGGEVMPMMLPQATRMARPVARW